jgi:microcystin-dependent protein
MTTKFANYYTKNTIKSMLNKSVPIGTILAYAVPESSVPVGFVLCDGSEYDIKGAFAKLFAVIGNRFGTPSVATKFKVPNIVNKTVIGADRNIKALGGTGGSETVKLALANMPVHNHVVTLDTRGAHIHTGTTDAKGDHSHTGTTGGSGSHSHTIDIYQQGAYYNNVYGTSGSMASNKQQTGGGDHTHTLTINNAGSHTHSLTIAENGAHSHTATVGNSGEGTAFSVVPPYIALNYIIKYDDPEPVENYENRMTYYLGVF